MNEFNGVYEAQFHPGKVALVSEEKPRKVNAARNGRNSALGCFCAAIKGEGQEPVTVSNKGAKL
ncbi:MAG: hypothetical protein R8K54_05525 [Mariprofundaceae bacterium]